MQEDSSPSPSGSHTRARHRRLEHPRVLAAALAVALSGCDRMPWAIGHTAFDGAAALAYVRTQVDFGPRVPGSPGHRRAGHWIEDQMRRRADTVIVQEWTHLTADGIPLPMRNVFAQFRPELPDRILYVAHWDTRPMADSDPILGNRRTPIPGANDGASGVALLMGVADVLRGTRPAVGVDLLFVDGEDYGTFAGYSVEEPGDVLIGSTYFARNPAVAGYRPMFGVVWDMIGDTDLRIEQEGHSLGAAPEIVARVWDAAAQLGYRRYFPATAGPPVTDDHVPLIRIAGWRVINVIDIDYEYHHTLEDTVDKVSARSLQIVGDVAVRLIPQ